MIHEAIKRLDDATLINKVEALAKSERECQVELLLHLAELDARQLYLGQGYSSLWDYCRRKLCFSEFVSNHRIAIARASFKYPALLDRLRDGRLTLCTAADLIPALSEKSAEALIIQAEGKSRREVQILAESGGKSKERDVIRPIKSTAQPALALDNAGPMPELTTNSQAPTTSPPQVGRPDITARRHRIAFTASDEVVQKLERLKDLLGGANLEDTIGKAADALLDRVDPARRHERRLKRKAKAKTKAEVKKPQTTKPASSSPKVHPRRPPIALRDAVMVRDGLRCTYVSVNGVRCSERRFLTIDHEMPYALGGTSTDQCNLRDMCAAHNGYLGQKTFGDWRSKKPAPNKVAGRGSRSRIG